MEMAGVSDIGGRIDPRWLGVLSDPVRLNLLRCLCEVQAVTTTELAPKAHTSERTVRRHLEALVGLGLAEEWRGESDGETPGRPAARYALLPRVREQALALFELLSRPLGSAPPPN
jgi:predicted ArsR family transcriptional regulator